MESTTFPRIKSIRFDGYRIEFSTNTKGQPVATLLKLLSSGKNKGTYRTEESYYFKSEERRTEWAKEKLTKIKERIEWQRKAADKLKEVKQNFENPFVVGDIYYDSWGYEQTNIDFYQIIEVKEKSVVIRRVAAIMCPYGQESGMSSNVKPDKDNFIGEPQTKIIQVRIWNGVTNVFIKSHHGWIGKYDKGDKGVYSSWYA